MLLHRFGVVFPGTDSRIISITLPSIMKIQMMFDIFFKRSTLNLHTHVCSEDIANRLSSDDVILERRHIDPMLLFHFRSELKGEALKDEWKTNHWQNFKTKQLFREEDV